MTDEIHLIVEGFWINLSQATNSRVVSEQTTLGLHLIGHKSAIDARLQPGP